MRHSLIVSARPEDAAQAVDWLTARLAAAGVPEARSVSVGDRLERAWSELLPYVFPRTCLTQTLMLEVEGDPDGPADAGPEVALVGERRGRLQATVVRRAEALGFSPEPEAGMDGLLRMRLSL